MENIVPTLDNVPVGFRFRPSDEELVDYYLKHKLLDDDYPINIIPDIDLCKVEPWDVPDLSMIKSDDPEWFFFSPLDYKYSNSKRVNRTTKCGFWKATGNDRYIKSRENNHVIGTKKTLVFYKGRVSDSVKSSWVIHEYHASTFYESQRTFVLCRLMKKIDKKTEGETNALICEEAEPSIQMASSDYENQPTTEGIVDVSEGIVDVATLPEMNMETIFQAEKYFPPIPQSPIGIEQEASFTNSPFHNAYFENEISLMQTSFETIEEENEFFNSIFADETFVLNEERGHVFVNNSTQSESLIRTYFESSDTDAEVVSTLVKYGNIVDTSTMCNEHPSSGEYHVSKMLKSSHGAIHGGIHLVSSNHEANKENKESIIQDDFWGVEESSCDSTTDKPLEANCIEISSSPSIPRRWKNQYHPRSSNLILKKTTARRSQTQRKVSSNVVSHLEAEKELTIVESEKRS